MKGLIPVKVECYSGFKADEYPVRFSLNNFRFEVKEILDRWYQLPPAFYDKTVASVPAANYFKVRTMDGKIFILKQVTDTDKWFLWIKGESINLFL